MKRFFLLLSLTFLVSACSPTVEDASQVPEQEPVTYTETSWQEMIDASCQSYFDGCNNCRRNLETGLAACTRKFCAEFEQPRCLDQEMEAEDQVQE